MDPYVQLLATLALVGAGLGLALFAAGLALIYAAYQSFSFARFIYRRVR